MFGKHIVSTAAVAAMLLLVPAVHDPDARIRELGRRIARNPTDARLYLQRGELYRVRGEVSHALADCARALALEPGLHAVHFTRGKTLLDAGRAQEALAAADVFVGAEPVNGRGLLLRARALRQIGRLAPAEAAYGAALAALAPRLPEHYLERARVQAELGGDGVRRALAGLDLGMRELGTIVSLTDCAIELELRLGNWSAALARIDAMLEPALRREGWLARKAGVLGRAGLFARAAQARREAVAAIMALPERHRSTAATRGLLASLLPGAEPVDPSSIPAPTAAAASHADASVAAPLPPAAAAPRRTETTLVPAGAVWRYLDDGSDQGAAWRAPGFDDSQWATGPAQLGYGDGDEQTVVGYGPNAGSKHITTYFRHAFQMADPNAFQKARLRLLRDDGAAVWLNGVEVARSNMPTGAIGYRTNASSAIGGSGEDLFASIPIDHRLLVSGTNVCAVEIHQSGGTSSDISFDLELLTVDGPVFVLRGPYLQRGAPTGAIVRWRTDVSAATVVWLGPAPQNLTVKVNDPALRTEHRAVLDGLAPDSTYYYAIGDGSGMLAGGDQGHRFDTPPAAGQGEPTRIWATGDSGTANVNAAKVRDSYLAFAGSRRTDVWLMLGDNAYDDGTDEEYQSAVFDMYRDLLTSTFLWPTLGNHDARSASSPAQSGVYYDIFSLPRAGEAGGLASGTEAYYSFDHGDIHFICLDSHDTDRAPTGAMMTWLRADLANTLARWVIAYWHHPPYSKGSHDSDDDNESGGRLKDMREVALPILEAGGVDLVLCGHSHSYERSFLLDGHYGKSPTLTPAMKLDRGDGRPGGDGAYAKPTAGPAAHEGSVYVVAGSSGQTGGGSLDHLAMFISFNSLGSLILDVDGDRLDGTFLDDQRGVKDTFTLLKGVSRTLTRDEPRISIGTGGTQNLFLDAGAAHAGKGYLVAGSLGTSPGFNLGPVHVPLNQDPWFTVSLSLANTPVFQQSLGLLDATGQAQAAINLPPLGIPNLIGLVLNHAYVVYDAQGFLMASNPVRLTLTP